MFMVGKAWTELTELPNELSVEGILKKMKEGKTKAKGSNIGLSGLIRKEVTRRNPFRSKPD